MGLMENGIRSSLSLVDLISEKHAILRKTVQEAGGEDVTRSEEHLLFVLRPSGVLSISEISRRIGLSRQGAHKAVTSLMAGEYLEAVPREANSRDRWVRLTDKGLAYCAKMDEVKEELERRIAEKLGREQVALLRELLERGWL